MYYRLQYVVLDIAFRHLQKGRDTRVIDVEDLTILYMIGDATVVF